MLLGWPLCEEWGNAENGILIGTGAGDLRVWNPIDDNAQAFELMVYLQIDFKHTHGGRHMRSCADAWSAQSVYTAAGKDRLRGARWAIVKAASLVMP